MAKFGWQLNALLRKNFIMMRRNIASTLAEIFFPIILMVLVVAVRQAFTIDTFHYGPTEKDDDTYVKKWSLNAITSTELKAIPIAMPPVMPPAPVYKDGFLLRPVLSKICRTRRHIAYVGKNFPQPIIDEIDAFTGRSDMGIVMQKRTYDSITDLENYISSIEYESDDNHPSICFGIQFETITPGLHFNYSLHYFDTRSDTGGQDVPSGKGEPLDEFQLGPDMKSYEQYVQSGYFQIMKICSDYILRQSTQTTDPSANPNARINFKLMPQKYSFYKKDPFGSFLGFIFPFFVIIAYICPLCIYVFRMVKEKETRAKEGMKIMGMGESTYFLSYFIQFIITNSIYALINSGIITIVFSHIPYQYLLGLFWLYGMNVFALAFFIQSFIDKTRIAMIMSILVYFVMFFISIAVFSEDVSKVAKGIVSLLPPVGVLLGTVVIGQYESSFKYFDSSKLMADYANYNVNLMYLMFLIDFFLYLFLGYYLQNVIPHQFGIARPFYFLCTKNYWCKSSSSNSKKKQIANADAAGKNEREIVTLQVNNDNFQSEQLYQNRTKKDDVLRILNIKKTFDDKKTAVDGVSLNIYKDEIFALLGHNGAGKSTLISMLSGLYEATSGEAYYDDENILGDKEMDIFRSKLGICPQHDVLFDDLTIEEHLTMFCYFKGVTQDKIKEEIDKTVSDFHIEDIKDIVVKNLSAGQRRKLSIAIALIGGSEVIFLDEPSSGMDITSRRNLWEILKRCTENKIIILTTHYMEEASVLGNRIGIISDGKMRCVGSSLFLIERFGKFVSLVLTKQPDATNEPIIDFIRSRAPKFEYEILSEEILIKLPKKATEEKNLSLSDESSKRGEKISNNGQFSIQAFFKDLDDNLANLKIKSYGASMPTLEDVFLNVASLGRNKKLERTPSMVDERNDKILFEENYQVKYSYCRKLGVDMRCSLKKRFLQIFRDLKSFVLEVLCPIVLIIIGLGVSIVTFNKYSPPHTPSLKRISPRQGIFYANFDSASTDGKNFYQDLKYEANAPGVEIVPIELTGAGTSIEDKTKEYMNLIYDIDMVNCYAGYYMLEFDNAAKTYDVVTLVDTRAKHGPMYYTAYMLQKIINKANGKEIKIDFQHKALPRTQKQKDSSRQMNNSVLVFFVAIAFSLIPANFITIIVKERENNSKHLQMISGISLLAYWLSNFICEIVKYYVVAGISLLLILAFDFFPDYLWVLYLLYGPAMIAFTYMLSFCFKTESSGQNTVILINFIFGALGSTVVVMLRIMDNNPAMIDVGKALAYIFRIVPAFGYAYGFNQLLTKQMLYITDYPKSFLTMTDSQIITPEYVGADAIFLGVEAIVYMIIMIIAEYFATKYIAPPQKKLDTNVNDSQVLKEMDRANRQEPSSVQLTDNTQDQYSIRIKNLQKNYKKGACCGGETVTGVKNLSFCLEYGECFGLLGVNGAGKTTAFKCLTQELSPSNGSISINGIDISNRFDEVRHMFGYCPQFDAIFEYMTVYENLEFYAALKGVKREHLDKLVTAMISEMSLTEYRKKVAGNLSGGNKRKLTVAISMICNPPIVLLDEPSTGMDPEARRFMWAVIHKISTRRKKSSVIMTTHSMDEAETLCRRMAIMVNGEFKCLGSSQMIKEKYGYGYEIDLRVMPLEDSVINSLFSNYKIDPKINVTEQNIRKLLTDLNKAHFIDELDGKRFGKNLVHELELNGKITVIALINWCHYVASAMRVISKVHEHFNDIILTEFIENNFLFKIKKNDKVNKSIGFLFGLVETIKEENNITEYSIQQTSLEQIFNQFALQQGKGENEQQDAKTEITITNELLGKLIQ